MTRSRRGLPGVRAFATKVNDYVVSRDSNGGVVEGWTQFGSHHARWNERCQFALILCGFRELDNVLSRVIMGSGPDPFRFPFPAWCSRLRQASHRRSSPGCIATYSFILLTYENVYQKDRKKTRK